MSLIILKRNEAFDEQVKCYLFGLFNYQSELELSLFVERFTRKVF